MVKWNLLDYCEEAAAQKWLLWHQSQHTVASIEISYERLIHEFDMQATVVIV